MDGWIEEMINGCHFATQLLTKPPPSRGPGSSPVAPSAPPSPSSHPGEPRASPASVSLPIRYTPAQGGKLAGWQAGFPLPIAHSP